MSNHAVYLNKVFNKKSQSKVIRDIKTLIKQKGLIVDGFVVTGVSGIVLGSILASSLGKDLVVVRKAKDNTHSTYTVENYKCNKSYIFLDDLIHSGKTYKYVKTAMSYCNGNEKWLYDNGKTSKIIGTILFDPINCAEVKYLTPQMVGKLIKKHGY